MKYLVIVVLCCLAVSSVSFAVPDAGPVNSNSSATARAVLSYLISLEGKNVITGQFGMFGSQTDPESSEQQLNSVYQYTGVYPAMTGADFNTPDKPPSQRIPEVVDWLSLKWSQGYLVSASWHAPNPCDGAYNSYNWSSSNPFDLNKVLPGGSCRSAYISMLDQIAGGLQTLQQRGVVVLWRPWHENNGEWFWWGNQTPAQFSALWVDMYNYFTYTKGLNNLLWVFSATTPWDQWALPADAVYPGDQYVDIVGLDEYMTTSENSLQLGWGTNPDASLSQSGYLQFSRIPKPMIIAEFGPIPASGSGYNTKAYNWGTLLSDLHSKYPRIVAFQAWEYVWQIARSPYVGQSAMMNDPLAISLSKLPNFRSGAQIPTSTPANTLPPGVTPSNTPTPLPSNTPTRTPTFTATVPPGSPSAISLTGTCDASGNALFTVFDVGLPLPSGVRIRWRMFDDGVEIGTGGSVYSPLPQAVSSGGGTFGNVRLMIWEVRDLPTNYSLVTSLPLELTVFCGSASPTNTSTAVPSNTPTRASSNTPTTVPSNTSTRVPTNTPTVAPTRTSTAASSATPTAIPSNTPTFVPTSTATAVPSTPTLAPTLTPSTTPTQPSVNTGNQRSIAITGTCDRRGNVMFTIFDAGQPLPGDVRIRWRMYDDGFEVGTGGSVYSPLPQTIASRNVSGNIQLVVWQVRNLPSNYTLSTRLPIQLTMNCTRVPDTSTPQPTVLPRLTSTVNSPILQQTPQSIVNPAPVINAGQSLIQSDSVNHTAGWSVMTEPLGANGGSYLINTSPAESLSLYFTGTSAQVVYLAGPSFGQFAIDVDGATQQVITSQSPSYGLNSVAVVSGLPNGTHELRIRPTIGVVAIDAFVAAPGLQPPPTQAASPTLPPTVEIPGQPTQAVPTAVVPTATLPPVPMPLPAYDNMDNGGSGWQALSGWMLAPQSAYNDTGNSWQVAGANWVDILRWVRPIDLTGVQPGLSVELTFQSLLMSRQSTAQVQISYDTTNWLTIGTVNPSDMWLQQTLSLNSYIGQIIYVQFLWQGVAPVNEQAADVWRIDEVSVAAVAPSVLPMVQSPTATLALPAGQPSSTVAPTMLPTSTLPPTSTIAPTIPPTSTVAPSQPTATETYPPILVLTWTKTPEPHN